MLVAKWNGVRVLEFNIGFGQPLLRWGKGETRYAIRLIPLGGYVRLAGMDDGEAGPAASTPSRFGAGSRSSPPARSPTCCCRW